MKSPSLKISCLLLAFLAVGAFLMARPTPELDRVEAARAEKGTLVRELAKRAGLTYPVRKIYLRAFKEERELEVWGSDADSGPYNLIHTYTIAAASGKLGPKRREGDGQVPEGFYVIDRFNPQSSSTCH